MASLNPLRCAGTKLPVNLLLMAKLIAVALLVTNHVRQLPAPFLPFIPGIDSLPPLVFQRTPQVVFLVSAVALIFNRRVRLSAFVLGATMIVAVVSSKSYYGNSDTFCGFILVLTGLYEPARGPWLIRLQHALYVTLSGLPPGMVFAKLTGWFTIANEAGLSAILLVRRLFPLGIWLSLCLQTGMMLFTGSTFHVFFYAITASMLAFARWPVSPVLVIFDGDCGFCRLSKGWVERFDLDRLLVWKPYQSGAGEPFGITTEDAQRHLYLVSEGGVWSGFGAFKMIVLWNPVWYLLLYTAIAIPGENSLFRDVTVATLLFLFSPLFTPIGNACYALVARNRHKLVANSTCQIG